MNLGIKCPNCGRDVDFEEETHVMLNEYVGTCKCGLDWNNPKVVIAITVIK